MSMVNHRLDPLNEERSVIDNLIASSQNLMGSAENPIPQQCPTPSNYQVDMTTHKGKIMKTRRGRTSFSPGQLSDLEAAFTNTHYPDFQTRKELSTRLKIPDDRIQVWFQNRRAKWRKTQRQVMNGSTIITGYCASKSNSLPSSSLTQTDKRVPSEMQLSYSMARPSPIQHTGTLVKSETTRFNKVECSAPQISSADSRTLDQTTYHEHPTFGNLVKTYEKLTAPHTSAELNMPENERTAPSLYSLSTAVTNSGQYIILGPSTNPPVSYPVNVNTQPGHVSSQAIQKY